MGYPKYNQIKSGLIIANSASVEMPKTHFVHSQFQPISAPQCVHLSRQNFFLSSNKVTAETLGNQKWRPLKSYFIYLMSLPSKSCKICNYCKYNSSLSFLSMLDVTYWRFKFVRSQSLDVAERTNEKECKSYHLTLFALLWITLQGSLI